MAKYGAWDIESYALNMFNYWGIGTRVNSEGILLLVSSGDRKARIELGEGYAHQKDDLAREIMQEVIIPKFKNQEYSAGIREGVQALDKLARGMPVKTAPWWHGALFVGLVVLGIGAAISLIRSCAALLPERASCSTCLCSSAWCAFWATKPSQPGWSKRTGMKCATSS